MRRSSVGSFRRAFLKLKEKGEGCQHNHCCAVSEHHGPHTPAKLPCSHVKATKQNAAQKGRRRAAKSVTFPRYCGGRF